MSHTYQQEKATGHLDELARQRKQRKIDRDRKADPLYLTEDDELAA